MARIRYLLNYNPPTDTTNIIYYCNIEWECMVYWIQEPCDEMVSQYLPSSNPWSSSRHVFTNFLNTNLRNFCTNIMYVLCICLHFLKSSKRRKKLPFWPIRNLFSFSTEKYWWKKNHRFVFRKFVKTCCELNNSSNAGLSNRFVATGGQGGILDQFGLCHPLSGAYHPIYF